MAAQTEAAKTTARPEEPTADERSRIVNYSCKALSMLEQLRLPPSPDNYSLFFHYAIGTNLELVREVDTAIANKASFSASALKILFNKYVIANNNQRLINDVTSGTNRVLSQVLRLVNEFGTETTHYANDIDTQVTKISQEIDDPSLQGLVRQVIASTAAIKQKSEQMNHKLVESKTEIETLRKNLDQVTQESQRDFLTGLFNRKTLDHMMDECIAAASQEPRQDLSMLMIDVDHFKRFNDKFGHLLGDEVLKIVSRAITYCVRGKDIVARYGGEEFVVLLPHTPLAGAAKVAENIRTTIASRDLKRKDTGESYGSLTVSIGAAQLKHGETTETLIKRADEGLYTSKNGGRNRVTLEE